MRLVRLLLLVFLAALAAPQIAAAAPSVAISHPAFGAQDKAVTINYAGQSEPTGSTNMRLTAYRELDATACAPNAYDQGQRLYSRSAGRFSPAAGPFSLSIPIEFNATGTWRICAYLNNTGDFLDSPPVAFATTTITITVEQSTGAKTCKVPKLRGLKVTKAKAALKRARCKLGRVKRTRGAKGKPLGSLRVVKQEFKAGTRLPSGRPIDITVG